MSEPITLGGRTFIAARLRRIGGTLSYFDNEIPVGTEVTLADARHGVANLVLNEGELVPVYAREITSETFKFVSIVSDQEAYDIINEAFRFQIIVGKQLNVFPGAILRRTRRPIMSWNQLDVPLDHNLTVETVGMTHVWYTAEGIPHRFFFACYLTDAYFTIVRT